MHMIIFYDISFEFKLLIFYSNNFILNNFFGTLTNFSYNKLYFFVYSAKYNYKTEIFQHYFQFMLSKID